MPDVPYISKEEIRSRADSFRTRYSTNKIPIDILGIAEFDLRLQIRPVQSLRKDCDQDAALLSKTIIIVDQDMLMEDRFQNRLRFSFAHEIGHLVLHGDRFEKIKIPSVDDWLAYYESFDPGEYRYPEWHANEFAGRLLVPLDDLRCDLEKAHEQLRGANVTITPQNEELIRSRVAAGICKKYAVSDAVILRRLDKVELWPSA